MNTETIAKRLIELCRKGQFEEAQHELYAGDAVSSEPEGLPPGMGGTTKGLPAILEKGRQFFAGVEAMHGNTIGEPTVVGNWFSLPWILDATMKGRGRVTLQEICVYQVRNGKIVREQFFYDVG
jgi:hypothetical protein